MYPCGGSPSGTLAFFVFGPPKLILVSWDISSLSTCHFASVIFSIAWIFSSSVMLLSMMAAALALLAADAGFALAGGFPDTYRAALPFPGAEAGSRRARTVESLGIISVSSVYSAACQCWFLSRVMDAPTLVGVLFVYLEIKVCAIS